MQDVARAAESWEADQRIAGVLRQIQEMALTLNEEAYFRQVEDLADSARRYLLSIPDPRMREDLRSLYRQVISYALELKIRRTG
jgi:archaellum biogenesis ATPase FlaH